MVKIKVVTVGHLPADFDRGKVKRWQSSVFEIIGDIESYSLAGQSDGINWAFTDDALNQELPKKHDEDFLVAIVNVPIEMNYYFRRLSRNTVVLTFHQIKDILNHYNVPIENAVFRLLYASSLVFKRFENEIPESKNIADFAHDETRGCLFDMTGIKSDVVYSCHKPIICPECVERLKSDRVSKEIIQTTQKEILKIQKPMFYRLGDFIKKHPIWSLIISASSALLLGIFSSLLATFIYEKLLR
jgi:hypothetical protein